MFSGATSFNSDLSAWDVSRGTDFVRLPRFFYCCSPFLYLCSLSHILWFHLDNYPSFFCMEINLVMHRLECLRKQPPSTRILVHGMYPKEQVLWDKVHSCFVYLSLLLSVLHLFLLLWLLIISLPISLNKCLHRVPCLTEPRNFIKTYVVGTLVVHLCLVDLVINFVTELIAFLVTAAVNSHP